MFTRRILAPATLRTLRKKAATAHLSAVRPKLFRSMPALVLALSIMAVLTQVLAPGASAATAHGSASGAFANPDMRGPGTAAILSVSPNSGPTTGGTVVTITYETISSPAVVAYFGGAEATTTGGVSGVITVIAPAHAAGTVQIQLGLAGGNASVGRVPQDEYTYVTPG